MPPSRAEPFGFSYADRRPGEYRRRPGLPGLRKTGTLQYVHGTPSQATWAEDRLSRGRHAPRHLTGHPDVPHPPMC